ASTRGPDVAPAQRSSSRGEAGARFEYYSGINAAKPLACSARTTETAAERSANGPTSTRVSGAGRSPPMAIVTAWSRRRRTSCAAASIVRNAPTCTQNWGGAGGASARAVGSDTADADRGRAGSSDTADAARGRAGSSDTADAVRGRAGSSDTAAVARGDAVPAVGSGAGGTNALSRAPVATTSGASLAIAFRRSRISATTSVAVRDVCGAAISSRSGPIGDGTAMAPIVSPRAAGPAFARTRAGSSSYE